MNPLCFLLLLSFSALVRGCSFPKIVNVALVSDWSLVANRDRYIILDMIVPEIPYL